MRAFEYTTPSTIQQAVSALGANSRALAGGTDLLTLMKADIAAPERLVNVKMRLPRGIEARPEGLEIGPLTTLADFFALPAPERRTETVLSPDELVLRLRLPPHPEETRSGYLKAMDRKAWAFALAGVACVLRLSGRKIAHARIVLSGVAPIPWRARAAERELQGAMASPDRFAAAAAAAVQEAAPLRHNGYKVPLTKALVRQALTALTDPACK